jgi:hypothetical protein
LSYLRRKGVLDLHRAVCLSLAIAVPKEMGPDAGKFARNSAFWESIFHYRRKKYSTFQVHLWYIFSTGQARFLHFFGASPISGVKNPYSARKFQSPSLTPGLESALLGKRWIVISLLWQAL